MTFNSNAVFFLSAIFIVSAFVVYNEPLFQLWKPLEQRQLETCLVNKPYLNWSEDGENLCYTKYWDEYCKIRDPANCPVEVLN